MELFNKLKSAIASAEEDAERFYSKNNKSAGTRLRNKMSEIKGLASDIRKNVSEIKNAK